MLQANRAEYNIVGVFGDYSDVNAIDFEKRRHFDYAIVVAPDYGIFQVDIGNVDSIDLLESIAEPNDIASGAAIKF